LEVAGATAAPTATVLTSNAATAAINWRWKFEPNIVILPFAGGWPKWLAADARVDTSSVPIAVFRQFSSTHCPLDERVGGNSHRQLGLFAEAVRNQQARPLIHRQTTFKEQI
jgi:hypothetical protein